MRRPFLACALSLASTIFFAGSSSACDLCAIYNSVESQRLEENSFRLGVSEQFTYYGTVRDGGRYVENMHHQHLASSITQIVAQYDLSSRFALQIALPYINRRFTRLEGEAIESGTVAGLGDASVLAKWLVGQYRGPTSNAFFSVSGGIKLPTGNSDRLGEEMLESDMEGMPEHAGTVHGHDLALGSGSVDVPLGALAFVQSGRYFASAELQYTIRTEGTHDYEFADDVSWAAGPGYYVLLSDAQTVGLRLTLSGERKARDFSAGEAQDDTRSRVVYVGPAVVASVGQALHAELALDLPLITDSAGVQSVPDYKLRAALAYRF